MSKADEIFEKLGYRKIKNQFGEIFLRNEYYYNRISFNYKEKDICVEDRFYEAGCFNMQELQAINEKCKELGWLDE